MTLIEITEQTHPIRLDLRYGSLNNFTHTIIYQKPRLLLHPDAVIKLEKAIDLAKAQGLTFKIFDGFRPRSAQEILWTHCPDPIYIMPPEKGSVHSRGVAIDLTLQDEQELDMGTPFDDFTDASHHGNPIDAKAQHNRFILLGIMSTAGFDFYQKEWWHYQLFSPKDYPLIDNDYGIMS